MITRFIMCAGLCILSICMSCVNSQITQTNAFEMELREFKYSLHKDVDNLDFHELDVLMEKGFKDHIVNKKCKAFYNKHREEIKTYQQVYLEKYKNTELNLDLIKEHEEINKYLEDGPLSVIDYLLHFENAPLDKDAVKDGMIVFKLMFIIPFHRTQSVIMQIISYYSGAEGIAAYNIKGLIVWPLIRTNELRNGYWEIVIDDYDWVYFFEFDLNEDELYLKKVYTR